VKNRVRGAFASSEFEIFADEDQDDSVNRFGQLFDCRAFLAIRIWHR
jgi:hypothetical protein